MAQKKYTTEYKLSIVDRVEKGESRNSISKKTGLSALTIKSWAEKKDQLIESLFEEAKNRKKTKRKKLGPSRRPSGFERGLRRGCCCHSGAGAAGEF